MKRPLGLVVLLLVVVAGMPAAAAAPPEGLLRPADPLAIVLGVETADLAKKHRLPLMVRARPEAV
jgi:hypothetical protein